MLMPQTMYNPGGYNSPYMGMMQGDSNSQMQVSVQQIKFLATQLRSHHAKDQNILEKVSLAEKLLDTGRVQEAGSTITDITNRDDKPPEDEEFYQ